MPRAVAIWSPAWYELDQALTVGDTATFWLVTTCSPMRFSTGLDTDSEELELEILAIQHAELGSIVSIDTNGLSYKFYSSTDDFVQIEAEETPGKFENGSRTGHYLINLAFSVQIRLGSATAPASSTAALV